VEYLLADVRYLPIRSNSVNFIYALSPLEHVERWDLVVREAFKALRSLGLLRRAIVSSTGYPDIQFSCH